jgi:S-(hydroxymethyl)glutathione dehydrogenase/alcohol dehydrogenase
VKAAVLTGLNQIAVVDDVEIDAPMQGEVLVRTKATGVCHSDWLFIEGTGPTALPAVLGHEGAGVVEAVGPGVTYVEPGDRVITTGLAFCGHCQDCMSGNPARCMNRPRMSGRPRSAPPRITRDGVKLTAPLVVTTFAEQQLVPETSVVKIPDEVSFDVACLFGCGTITGLGSVFRAAQVQPGSSVVVFGTGGVGLSTIQGARIAGARQIIAVDVTDEKLARARQVGATHVVNVTTNGDPVDAVLKLTDRGVDFAFEAVGNKVTGQQALATLAPGGLCTLIGAGGAAHLEVPYRLLGMDRRLQGVYMGRTQTLIDIPRYIELYLNGVLMMEEMITHRGRIEDLSEAFQRQHDHQGARTVLHFD